MKIVKLKSPAKINLILEVIRKLPNGFHKLRTVMMKLENLYDEIEIVFNKNNQNLEIACENKDVPADKRNICWKIAEKFFEKTGHRIGLGIKIKKNIPLASGMGGGSSNGASVLLAFNDYFKNPLNFKELVELASGIGKDIPFFLQKERAAFVSGMGEKIKPLKNFPRINLLIINSGRKITTPWAYGEIDRKLIFMNNRSRKNISLKFLESLKSLENMSLCLYNDFEIIAKNKYSDIEILEKALISFGAEGASLSGKGPTVFGFFKNKKGAQKARTELKKYFPSYFIELG